MGATPEGLVKHKVDRILGSAQVPIWHFKPVQTGYGGRALDYLCCIAGTFVGIETKALGEQPTKLQRITMIDIHFAGGKVFIISNDDGLAALSRWIGTLPVKPWGSSLW